MAFFKFSRPDQKRGKDKAPVAARAESIEAMRRRAKHRLIGAAVLVLIGVVGFPLVFDTQPRPIGVDIPIQIPDRNQAKPLVIPPSPVAAATGHSAAGAVNPVAPVAAASSATAQVPTSSSLGSKEQIVSETPDRAPTAPATGAPPATVAKAEPKPATESPVKPPPRSAPKAAAQTADAARIEALLNDKAAPPPAASESGRFVVQVGAFADAAKAREARQKVEKAGLKTYTQVVQTKDGERTRVRVGPFSSRAEADKAAGKIKGLALPAAILAL